jgi:hypothetical protein
MPFKLDHPLFKNIISPKNIKLYSKGDMEHWEAHGFLQAICHRVVSQAHSINLSHKNPNDPALKNFLESIIDIGLNQKVLLILA